MCERVSWRTEQTATYWPQVPLSLAALLSRSVGLLNRGSWGPSPLWELVLTTASYLQLTEPVCGTGLYNSLTPTCFLWVSHRHPIQPVHSQCYTLISSTGCTCYLHRCMSYLTAWPRLNMLHVNPTLFGIGLNKKIFLFPENKKLRAQWSWKKAILTGFWDMRRLFTIDFL